MGNAGYGNHTEDTKNSVDQNSPEGGKPGADKSSQSGMHPAGPHAKPELSNPDSTPGTGALPENRQGGEADSSSG
ncbi:MAG TPA: hypothetical protein VEZ24_04220 [Microvirga sp.]|nr:hypothetical protein [Microvirga sp.]